MTEFTISCSEKAVVMTSLRVTADTEAEAIAKARKHFGGDKQEGVTYIEADTYCVDPPSAKFEIVEAVAEDFGDGDDGAEPHCTNPGGHSFVYTGTQYGGDDPSYMGEGRCYCEHCGADGDA